MGNPTGRSPSGITCSQSIWDTEQHSVEMCPFLRLERGAFRLLSCCPCSQWLRPATTAEETRSQECLVPGNPLISARWSHVPLASLSWVHWAFKWSSSSRFTERSCAPGGLHRPGQCGCWASDPSRQTQNFHAELFCVLTVATQLLERRCCHLIWYSASSLW